MRKEPSVVPCCRKVVCKCASSTACLLATALLRNRSIVDTWSPELIVEDEDFKVSGVPTWHTMLAAVLESLRLTRNLPGIIKTDILAELDKRDAASGTVSSQV